MRSRTSSTRTGMLAALAVGITVSSCSSATHPSAVPDSSRPAPTATTRSPVVTVAGRELPWTPGLTVRAALQMAKVAPADGHLLAIASHRLLGSDHLPGAVFLNSRAISLSTAVADGDIVTVTAGPDRVERTRTAILPVPPPNPSNLYIGGNPGRAEVQVGLRSGEHLIRRVLVPPRIGRLQSPGAVALTIDDGPDPRWTPQVLSMLAAAHVHATFCLIGLHVHKYPALVRDIVAGGHQLCDHTWDHDEQLRSRPPGEISLDISRGAAAIKNAAGIAPPFFRAPGGAWSPFIEAEARRQHMIPLHWTVDPRDWARPGVGAIVDTVYQELRPGGVILMHDGGGDRSQSVEALKILLSRLPAMGYHFVVPLAGNAASSSSPAATPGATSSPRASG